MFNTPWITGMPPLLSPLPPAEGDGPGNDGLVRLVEIATKCAVVPPPARVWLLVVSPLAMGPASRLHGIMLSNASCGERKSVIVGPRFSEPSAEGL